MGLWEKLPNSGFKGVKFEAFVREAASNAFALFQFRNLQHICGQVFGDGEAAGVDDDVAAFDEGAFFQDRVLVVDDVVHAFFFGVVEGADAPAEAELVDQAFFLRENVERAFWPVAGHDEGGVA